jgi:error-prone DNA polymerase
MSGFVELVAATNYSFLDGASHAEDMVAQAITLRHAGIGIAIPSQASCAPMTR